ncbi:hypothetical protein [Cellulomonas fimi]|uniref:hypothetical protein n=1 Tax=Cellulomonas sp. RIT-PI-Y TaxID=3035297 RepID=UPI0021D83CAB
MTRPLIGWYVHHHGSGHLGRLRAIAPHLDAELLCFSSLPEPAGLPAHCRWVALDRDDDGTATDPTAGGLLHWAPLGHPGHTRRLATLARALQEERADALVVDVSVEVTLLARLLGIPPVLIAQPGVRDDLPHTLGLRAAARVVAPWPAGLMPAPHLEPVRSRVHHVGGISRFEGRARPTGEPSGVLLLGGRGGTDVDRRRIDEAVAGTPDTRWTVLGPSGQWLADPWDALTGARTVVAWAGQNSIADLAVADARAVVIPQPRPFDEQLCTARALAAAGLAVVAPDWPDAPTWPRLLDEAAALEPDWSRWRTRGAAARAAEVIDDVARGRSAC